MPEKKKSPLRDSLGQIIGPRSASLTVGFWVLVPLTLGTAFSDIRNLDGLQIRWMLTALQAFILAVVFFAVGGLFVTRFTRPRSRVIGFLSLFALTECVRSVAVTLLAHQAGALPEINWSFRIISGVLTGLAAFSVASGVANLVYFFREKLNDLIVQRARLKVLQNRSEHELALVRAAALRDVRDRVDEAISTLTADSAKPASSATSVVAALIEVADTVIRPLSHQLMLEPREMPTSENPVISRKSGASLMFDFVTRVAPIQPRALPTFLFFLGFGAAATLIPNGLGILLLVAALAVMSGVLWLARCIVQPHLARWRVVTRIAVISMINTVVAVGTGLSAALPAGYQPEQLIVTLIYTTVVFNGVAWVIAVPRGLQEVQRQTLHETEAVNARLAWKISRDNSLLWAEQKQLSHTLHQEIQGTLIAAAFRLQRDIETGGDTTQSLADVRELITAAARQSVTPRKVNPFREGLEEMRDRWAGVIDITWSCEDSLTTRINGDDVTRRIIYDLSGEFITNSVKHGRAPNAAISIVAAKEHLVHLSLTNDGAPLPADAIAGLGTRLARNVGLAAGFTPLKKGIEFHVDLTLAPNASRA